MTSVGIVGTGNMGTAIHDVLNSAGASVRHLGKENDAEITDDVVVLAVPYEALSDIVEKYRDQLVGKIVVDITNPVDFGTLDSLQVQAGSSAAHDLQVALPESVVLKAFNTNFAATLGARQAGEHAATVLVAGDDVAAKDLLIGLVGKGGLAAIDAGRLTRARELEAMGFLQITLATAEKVDWSGGFSVT